MLSISTSATCVIQEMSARNRTWNLFPGKVNQQYPHTKVNQHMLAEEVPNNTNKNQIPSLRSQLSNIVQPCPICSVAPIQTSTKMRLATKFPDKRIFWVYIQPRSSTICCRRDSLIRTKVPIYKKNTYSFTFIL